jgi:hypothetical protein
VESRSFICSLLRTSPTYRSSSLWSNHGTFQLCILPHLSSRVRTTTLILENLWLGLSMPVLMAHFSTRLRIERCRIYSGKHSECIPDTVSSKYSHLAPAAVPTPLFYLLHMHPVLTAPSTRHPCSLIPHERAWIRTTVLFYLLIKLPATSTTL